MTFLERNAVWLGLFCVILVASLLRGAGQNWDGSRGWHFGEQWTVQQAVNMDLPDGVANYLDTATSRFNPRNVGPYYSAGTFPLFAGKLIAIAQNQDSYAGLTQTYRSVSAFSDLITVGLVFLIGRRLRGSLAGIVAAFLYGLAPITIQLSHFGTFDTTATMLASAVFYFGLRASGNLHLGYFLLGGLCAGLAMASIYPFTIVLTLLTLPLLEHLRRASRRQSGWRDWLRAMQRPLLLTLLSIGVALVIFRLAQPYAFQGPGLLDITPEDRWQVDTEMMMNTQRGLAEAWTSPEWALRVPVAYSFFNLILRGFGLVLGVTTVLALASTITGLVLMRRSLPTWQLYLVGWPLLIVFVNGRLFMQEVRLLLPAAPFLILIVTFFLVSLMRSSGRAAKWPTWARIAPLTIVLIATAASGLAMTSIFTSTQTRIAATQWIFENVPAGAGLLVEANDVLLPIPIDGYPAQSDYAITTLPIYDMDSDEKLDQLLAGLTASDFVILSSNRGYDSLPRVIEKYPMIARYYELLRTGGLGFDRVATFENSPTILGEQIIHEQLPMELTNFDHPTIEIYRKTTAYNEDQVRALLEPELVGPVVDIRSAVAGKNMLLMTDEQFAEQRASGTWSALFDPTGLTNRHPMLTWYLMVQLLGVIAVPISWRALRHLSDKGYAASKPLGLLIVATVAWLLGSYELLAFGRRSVYVSVLAVATPALLIVVNDPRRVAHELRSIWRWILTTEVLFAAAYVAFAWARRVNPDIWSAEHANEKLLDFATLNAVIKSASFPPYDPWFSGGIMNYYYFGYVPPALLSILSGVMPSVAYNLALASTFGMAVIVSWSIVANLVAATIGMKSARNVWKAIGIGLTGVLFYCIVGSLDLSRRIGMNYYDEIPLRPNISNRFGAVGDIVAGVWRGYEHRLQLGWNAFWYPSRVIPFTVNEFPYYTFTLADLHPHLLVIPFTLVAVLLGIGIVGLNHGPRPPAGALLVDSGNPEAASLSCWLRGCLHSSALRDRAVVLCMLALVTGAIYPMNTWSYPTYIAVTAIALFVLDCVGSLQAARRPANWTIDSHSLRRVGLSLLFVLIAGRALFYPFFQHTESQARGFVPTPFQTRPGQYMIIFGMFVFFCSAYLLGVIWQTYPRLRTGRLPVLPSSSIVLATFAALVAMAFLIDSILLLLASLCALVVASLLGDRHSPAHVFFCMLIGLAIGLSLFVERWALMGDFGRLNTVYKIHMDVWLLWSLMGAISLFLTARAIMRGGIPRVPGVLWAVAGAILILASLTFPLFATNGRLHDRLFHTEPTLDGMAFLREDAMDPPSLESGDEAAIHWMLEHVDGSPVVLEGLPSALTWGWRVSAFTGLPTVLGWFQPDIQRLRRPNHETLIQERIDDIQTMLGEARSFENIQPLLDKYQIEYIYIGPVERAIYRPEALLKFKLAAEKGLIETVYQDDHVTIYKYQPTDA